MRERTLLGPGVGDVREELLVANVVGKSRALSPNGQDVVGNAL